MSKMCIIVFIFLAQIIEYCAVCVLFMWVPLIIGELNKTDKLLIYTIYFLITFIMYLFVVISDYKEKKGYFSLLEVKKNRKNYKKIY